MLFARGAVTVVTAPSDPLWRNLSETLTALGESPLVVFRCDSGNGLVGFQTRTSGRVYSVGLEGSAGMTVSRKRILALSPGVNCDPVNLDWAGIGSLPQKMLVSVYGNGRLFLHGPGNLVEFTLRQDEKMVVDGLRLVAMDGGVGYEPKSVSQDPEPTQLPGILMMNLTGPGRVVLHTEPGD
jgi:uncharacterized protein (AIM24 family)